MNLPALSLLALVLVVAASCLAPVNPGFLAVVLAWLIAVYVAPAFGQPIGMKELAGGFPAELFLTLVGVTLLFQEAQGNGTLDRVAQLAVRACRGSRALVPVAFFLLAAVLSSIGAGNIAAAALVAPPAMAAAGRLGIPPVLMILMVGHGAIGGSLSPFSPTGLVANGLLARMGLPGHEGFTYLSNLLANLLVAALAYALFARGLARRGRRQSGDSRSGAQAFQPAYAPDPCAQTPAARLDAPDPEMQAVVLERAHWLTFAVLGLLIAGVVFLRVHVGMGAFAAALLLVFLRVADEKAAVRALPWSVIMMVCGVTVLTSLMEKTGGTDLFTTLLARFADRRSVTGLIALVTGLLSVTSSTTGVVLPAFLPAVPGLVQKLGGGDPLAIAASINIGGNLVDVSPLSTIGALCIAAVPATEDRRAIFNQVLAWGLAMSLVGAAICYLFFGLLR